MKDHLRNVWLVFSDMKDVNIGNDIRGIMMKKYPKLLKVEVISTLKLILHYENNEERVLNLQKYMISDFFRELEDFEYFKKVKLIDNTVSWPNEQDIAPETIYTDSKVINSEILESI